MKCEVVLPKFVWFNGHAWCVATSPAEATAYLVKQLGYDPEEAKGDGWKKEDDSRTITVDFDDGEKPKARTCAEWTKLVKGHLASVDH